MPGSSANMINVRQKTGSTLCCNLSVSNQSRISVCCQVDSNHRFHRAATIVGGNNHRIRNRKLSCQLFLLLANSKIELPTQSVFVIHERNSPKVAISAPGSEKYFEILGSCTIYMVFDRSRLTALQFVTYCQTKES